MLAWLDDRLLLSLPRVDDIALGGNGESIQLVLIARSIVIALFDFQDVADAGWVVWIQAVDLRTNLLHLVPRQRSDRRHSVGRLVLPTGTRNAPTVLGGDKQNGIRIHEQIRALPSFDEVLQDGQHESPASRDKGGRRREVPSAWTFLYEGRLFERAIAGTDLELL